MGGLKRILVGIGHDPQVVAAARAFAIYVLPLAVEALVAYLGHLTDPRWLGVPAASVPLLRVLEGAIDRALRPDQNAVNPDAVAGGGSPDLLT